MKGFIEFIRKQGVIGLAIGFILGAAVANVVTALVNDIINPLIGIVLGGAKDLASYSTTIMGAKFAWGNFLNVLIDFIIVSLVIYSVFKALKLDKLDIKEDK